MYNVLLLHSVLQALSMMVHKHVKIKSEEGKLRQSHYKIHLVYVYVHVFNKDITTASYNYRIYDSG